MHRIVVDAMGGDHAPDAIVAGAAEASLALGGAEIILVGDAAAIGRLLPGLRHDGSRVRVHHAPDRIEMDEHPIAALEHKPQSSIAVGVDLVARGEADALVSAGNTGASVVACSRGWKLIPGVPRAALAAVYPTELRRGDKDDPFSLILDVGATVECTADDLVGFALMGAAYAKLVSKNRRPRVALLSNGSEATKGPRSVVSAHAQLAASKELNFIGNIEGVDIPRGVADVVVTSGFVGNVVLKMLEGVSETVVRLARYAHKERLAWRLGLLALGSAIDQLKQITDWQQYGGAPLLGFQHPFIKAHGRSNARAVTNAVKLAHKALAGDLAGEIARTVGERGPAGGGAGMSLLHRARMLAALPVKVGERIGLLDYVPAGLREGEAPPTHVFRWDLDKTYLRTEFDSLGDLVKSALEEASDKQAYPGATALLRALRTDGHRVCIVSGSPTQMRQVLVAKLALDGVEYDEFVLKNNLKNILRGRFRAMRAQIPYKLPAMLQSRIGATAAAETLFGDDAEADAVIYCLYADLVAGTVSEHDLERVLIASRAYDDDAARILDLARRVPKGPAVRRMFIHLDRRSPPLGFRRFGPRLVPVFNYFQAALVLYQDGVLTARQVIFVALEMLDSKQYELGHLATSVQDIIRRGRVERETAIRLTEEATEAARSGALSGRDDLPPFERIAEAFRERVRSLGAVAPPPPSLIDDAPLDYVQLVDEEHEHRRDRRKRGLAGASR